MEEGETDTKTDQPNGGEVGTKADQSNEGEKETTGDVPESTPPSEGKSEPSKKEIEDATQADT